jgi:hypothetical protein
MHDCDEIVTQESNDAPELSCFVVRSSRIDKEVHLYLLSDDHMSIESLMQLCIGPC